MVFGCLVSSGAVMKLPSCKRGLRWCLPRAQAAPRIIHGNCAKPIGAQSAPHNN